ncbi:hypothetical protein ACH4VR_29220 [Streptomyces sp. NPDC020883]|uniref:hypothetical protein n=1 Tax=Streptomyces sp. NPDC020883 TaxID=3365099 RepID=UPI0037AEEADD
MRNHGSQDEELSRPAERQIPTWASTVGPGWAALLDQRHHDLLSLDTAYRQRSFGTKFGGLRVTVAALLWGTSEQP